MSVAIKVCCRCGHEWATKQDRPLRCARCKSAYWDRPKVRGKGSTAYVAKYVVKGDAKEEKEGSRFSRLFQPGRRWRPGG